MPEQVDLKPICNDCSFFFNWLIAVIIINKQL